MDLLKKAFIIIPKEYKLKKYLLIFLILLGMVFEIFGIGVLLPTLTAVIQPELLLKNDVLKIVFTNLNITNDKQIINFSLMVLFVLYTTKSIYLLWLSYTINKFNFTLIANISNKLYLSFLSKPYKFHVSNNSSGLIKILQIEVKNFGIFFLALLNVISETAIILAVVFSLTFIEPLGTLSIISFFCFFSFLFYSFTKKFSNQWGEIRESNDAKISKFLLETFGGIKDIIISNSFNFFNKKNINLNSEFSSISTKNITLNQVPRFYLELITVLAFISFVFYLTIKEYDVNLMIVTLGIFTAAALRILPSINRILFSLQQLKFYKKSVDIIHEQIKNNDFEQKLYNDSEKRINIRKSLHLKNLDFSYSGREKKIFDKIDLKIIKGSVVGIIGLSGSGKSTLVNILGGLISSENNDFKVDEKKLSPNDINTLRNNIGYVSQTTFLLDASIIENIAFGVEKEKISIDRINEVIREAQLEKLVNSLPEGYETIVGERGAQFSGGEQQRIGIARALYRNPDVLILDESTSALDTSTESELMKSIYKLRGKKTIIIVTHRLSTIKGCDKIYSLKNGNLILI